VGGTGVGVAAGPHALASNTITIKRVTRELRFILKSSFFLWFGLAP